MRNSKAIKKRLARLGLLFLCLVSAWVVNALSTSSANAITANRYFGGSWYFTLDDNGVLRIQVKNSPRTYDGLHQDFNGKSDWDAIWKTGPSGVDIRPYVKEVKFNEQQNTKWSFNGFRADGMFEGFTEVESYSFHGIDASDAVSLRNFFKNNTSLKELDVWRFGNMPNIINMDGFIEGCENLTYLRLDTLDNSNIGPTNKRHTIMDEYSRWPSSFYNNSTDYDPVSKEDSMITGAAEYGREIFGKGVYDIPAAFPKLKKISAKESNVWLVKDTKGLAGAEYYNASNDSDVLYLFNTETNFTPDGKESVKIDSKRDYVDIITDRNAVETHSFNPALTELPDVSTNLNILYDLNTNGAGHIAPGVYEIGDTAWEEIPLEFPDTYYRIAYIGEVPFKIEGVEDDDEDLKLIKSSNYSWLNTVTKDDWPTSGDYIIDRSDRPIKITYENAAIDVNGKKHNVVININKITFKNLEKIPTWRGNERIHNVNRYIDYHPTSPNNQDDQSQWTTDNEGYYRTILQATRDDGVTFRNYVRVGNGNTEPGTSYDWQVLSGGSGTDIDFTIEIEGANDETTFIFHGEDVDVPESQRWNYPNDDADYDNLPINQETFGVGGEGFILGDGNKLTGDDTVIFAKETGLRLVDNNKVVTTGSDPNTSWSEFAVKSDATGSNYTWTSGIAATSYALKNTPKIALGEIKLEPVAKVFSGGSLSDGQFEFILTPDDAVEGNEADGPAIVSTNDANGNVTFDAFTFNSPKVTIGDNDYYPGTVNDETNTHGEGTHITHVFAWTIQEIDAGDPNIWYDSELKHLKMVVKTPETDEEMKKGIGVDIYVDNKLVATKWSKDVEDNIYTADVTFNNILVKDVNLKVHWVDEDNPAARPDIINGFLKYRLGESGDVTVAVSTWQKENNTWTANFKIPVAATVLDWGEESIPDGYVYSQSSYIDGSDSYEFVNSLKLPDPEPEPAPEKTTPEEVKVPNTGLGGEVSSGIITSFIVFPALAGATYLTKRYFWEKERNKNSKNIK